MTRVRWFFGSLTLILLVLTSCLSYPILSGFGSWTALPTQNIPSTQSSSNNRFEKAGNDSFESLKTHRQKHGIPGLTAAVAFDGAIVWQGAVGWADVDGGIPIQHDTVLRIGSTSKAVTATALARLIDTGKLNLDEPLSKYSKDLPNPAWNQLTPRQLASHTAGFPEYSNNGDHLGKIITLRGTRHYTSVRESLEIFDGASLLYPPGTDFAYSSFDVNLLGAIMAEIHGKPFLSTLEELVFSPLHLESSGGDHDGIHRPQLSKFHQTDGTRCRIWRPFDLSQRWPGGGLVSTSTELATLGISWLDPEFISPSTRKSMWTPQKLENGQINEQQYAIGWRFYAKNPWPGDSTRTIRMAHHGGVSKGAMSWLVVYPDFKLAVALNSNARLDEFSDFNAVESDIAARFLSVIESRQLGVSPNY